MRVYMVLGLCGAGKTTLINRLKENYNNIYAFDFDDIGVPDIPTHEWRIEATETWLKRISASDRDVVLAGFMYPDEIINSKSYNALSDVEFVYIKKDLDVIRERLRMRSWSEDQIEWTINQEEVILSQLRKLQNDKGILYRVVLQ